MMNAGNSVRHGGAGEWPASPLLPFKIAGAFLMALVLLAAIGIASLLSVQQLTADEERENHSHYVLQSLESVLSLLQDVESGARGYAITGDPAFLAPYDKARGQVLPQLQQLRQLISSEPSQLQVIDALQVLSLQRTRISSELVETRKTAGFDAARAAVLSNRGQQTMDLIRSVVNSMETLERRLLSERERASAATGWRTKFIIVSGSVLALLFFAFSVTVILREVRERQRVHEERGRLVAELQDALASIKSLSGLLPICAKCKKIRDGQDSWKPLETYVHEHSEAEFTHGLCPDCARELFPGAYEGAPTPPPTPL